MIKAYITNTQCPSMHCGYGMGNTWAEAVADALLQDTRAYIGDDGRVYVNFFTAL